MRNELNQSSLNLHLSANKRWRKTIIQFDLKIKAEIVSRKSEDYFYGYGYKHILCNWKSFLEVKL